MFLRRWITILCTLILAAMLPACGSNEPTTDVEGELLGTEWVLVSLNGSSPLDDTISLVIGDNGVVVGYAGCNNYSVRQVAIGRGSFRAFQVLHEDMGCPGEGYGQQEDAYLQALGNSAYYRMKDGRLEIQDNAGETALVYVMKE